MRREIPQDVSTRGEGGDCSGLTFKTWFERSDWTDPGSTTTTACGTSTARTTAAAFKRGDGYANLIVSKTAVIGMDALASGNHIGIIYQANTAYNTDRIVEAKGEACGTGIWTRTYRGDPSYGGVGAPAGRTDRRAGAGGLRRGRLFAAARRRQPGA